MPEGSVRTGWTKTERDDGSNLGSLTFEGGLIACPRNETQPWQVYGQLPNVKAPSEECLGFGATTCKFCPLFCLRDERVLTRIIDKVADAAAWQY